jgi:hypothetical protein
VSARGAVQDDSLEAVDFIIAFAVGLLALLGFLALSLARGKQLPPAKISDENAKYVKVSIAPVSAEGTRKGDKTSAVPNAWARKKPPPEALKPPTDDTTPTNAVSTASAAPTDSARHPPDAAAPLTETDDASTGPVSDAGPLEFDDAMPVNNDADLAVAAESEAGIQSDGSTPGVSEGVGNSLQENQKANWYARVRGYMIGRFYGACASMPDDAKKDGQNKRHAGAVIVVTGRHIDSSSLTNSSGNGAFDSAVTSTLAAANAGFPAPPDSIADQVVGVSIPLDFVCN